MFNKDKCDVKECNEPRKKGGLFPTAYCEGHWFMRIAKPYLDEIPILREDKQ